MSALAPAIDNGAGRRMALALLAALALHVALLFGIPAEWRLRHFPAPRRFDVVLLPPASPEPRSAALPEPAPVAAVEPAPAPPPPLVPPQPVIATRPVPATASTPVAVTRPAPKPVPPARPTVPVKPARPTVPVKPARPPSVATAPPPARPAAKPREVAPPPVKPVAPAAKPAAPANVPEPARAAGRPERSEPAGEITAARRPAGKVDSTNLLGQIAGLEAETERKASAGVRVRQVSLTDSRSLAGFYAADWARKVTRVGEMNFPDAARRLNLSAGPLLDVAIRADGSLREVRVMRSSGNAELDRAARRIVELAAPYPPFPAELRQQVDLLRIESPWRFDPGGRIQAR